MTKVKYLYAIVAMVAGIALTIGCKPSPPSEANQRTRFKSARQVIEHLTDEVTRYRDGAEPNDDVTMMCLILD